MSQTTPASSDQPVWRPAKPGARYAEIWRQLFKEGAVNALRRAPGMRRFVDHPRTQPIRSAHSALLRWAKAPYGTPEKPASLAEVPWEYVKENEAEIPFLGLREYWYPALRSAELMHNEPKPATMLGDNIVFFRDAEGKPRALENRCPHRSPLLSLGQVGVFEPGTITCRYHGMTFNGDGACVAFLTDGPDSGACGKIRAKSYPTEEAGGIIWIYMGEKDPQPLLDAVPHLRDLLENENVFVSRREWPINYLATLDNDMDLAHPGVTHRACTVFSGQKLWGEITAQSVEGGVYAQFSDDIPHPSKLSVDAAYWFLPNFAYFGPGMIRAQPEDHTFVWAVPRDIGNSAYWFIISRPKLKNPVLNWLATKAGMTFAGLYFMWPGSPMSCVEGADKSMMQSQGRIARWDRDRLIRIDRPVTMARQKLKRAHRLEREEAKARAESRAAGR